MAPFPYPRLPVSPGEMVYIDVSECVGDPPILVRAVVLYHLPDCPEEGPRVATRISAPDGHPWAQHNGMEFYASACPAYLYRESEVEVKPRQDLG